MQVIGNNATQYKAILKADLTLKVVKKNKKTKNKKKQCTDMKVSWLVTPSPPAIGQLPRAIKPEPHLIPHVTAVHIGGTLYNILGELVKVTVFGPQAIVCQMNTDFWASQKTSLVSHKQTF